jgi:hypothetical protein
MNLFQNNPATEKLFASVVVGISSLTFAIPVTLPAQAQSVPIGMNSRIPGVGSLGTNPGFKGANGQQSGYYANLCNRLSRGQYGRFVRAQPYMSNKVTCDMERASFLVLPQQRF